MINVTRDAPKTENKTIKTYNSSYNQKHNYSFSQPNRNNSKDCTRSTIQNDPKYNNKTELESKLEILLIPGL